MIGRYKSMTLSFLLQFWSILQWHSAKSILDAARDVDVLVIMTPWAEFREVKPADLQQAMKGRVIVDPFQVLIRFRMYFIGISILFIRPAFVFTR